MIIEDTKQNSLEAQFSLGDNSLSLFNLLTSKLYSDPIYSFMRELIANAIDACIENNLPVRYTVTLQNGEFTIRDYGSGLHKEELKTFYLQLGSSTKTHTNKLIGGMGIGRLSPLSHSDEFTVNSYYEGFVTNLTVFKSTGVPTMKINHFTQTNEPNGLQVIIPIQNDSESYAQKTLQDIAYFLQHKPENEIPKKNAHCPDFNLDNPVTLTYYEPYVADNFTCAVRPSSPFVQVWIDGFIYQTQINSNLAKSSAFDITLKPNGYTYTVKLTLDDTGVVLTPNRESLQNNPQLQQMVITKLNQYIDNETNMFFNNIEQEPYLDNKVRLVRHFLYRREFNHTELMKSQHPIIARLNEQILDLNKLLPFSVAEISSKGRVTTKVLKESCNLARLTTYLRVAGAFIVNDTNKSLNAFDPTYFTPADEDAGFHRHSYTVYVFSQNHKETMQKLIDPANLTLLSQVPLKQPTIKSSETQKVAYKRKVYYRTALGDYPRFQFKHEPLLDPHSTTNSFYIFTDKEVIAKNELIFRQLISTQSTGLIQGDFRLYIAAPTHKKRIKEPFFEISYDPNSIKPHLPLLNIYTGFNIKGYIAENYYKSITTKQISDELKTILNSLLNNNLDLRINTQEIPDINISDVAILFKQEVYSSTHDQETLTINLAEEIINFRSKRDSLVNTSGPRETLEANLYIYIFPCGLHEKNLCG